ncbi:glucosylceramidase [Pelagirhabdus alkalitolerans]|uniref:Glucosylceramidase n=1 Tax=Pelagirhabdus alkalitolerans TaxID=1612202 RepID=A0A1G6K0B1_9BACI|nr:glycoside hydrolase family 30 protein [Pelagirhabdus alkalitolerans]SDC24075.1 glucosylceramidase [Pelagirhabdus alkalitolerans]
MSKNVKVVQSIQEKNKFWETNVVRMNQHENNKERSDLAIYIDSTKEYQEWKGFGGAITEAAAYNLSKLSKEKRESILQAYYGKNGLGYTHGRVHINSSDFGLGNYDYIDENDESLSTFSIEREEQYVLPIIREINQLTGDDLTLLASPWSPPAWMKTNGEMNNGGKLKKEYYPLWAKYFVKYIKEMRNKGIDIWAVTVQNEPAAKQVWDSCEYTGEEEKEFVKQLGEEFAKENLEDIKIIIWDHNRDIIVERADAVLNDPEARQYVWGVGNHWYVSEEFENLSKVHEKYPEQHMIFTEGCIEGGVQLGAWHTGERYARNIIGDMNNWLEAFIDWNIVLDMQGGPNHVGNYCDAPIIVDPDQDVAHYNSSYYFIGHFSQYIKAGAKRTDLQLEDQTLSATAFKNVDGSIVVVILNETNEQVTPSIHIDESTLTMPIPAHSITTCIINEQVTEG